MVLIIKVAPDLKTLIPLGSILMQDDFNDNSIDTSKWIETDPDGVIFEQNAQIEYDEPTPAVRSLMVNRLVSVKSVSSGKIEAIADLDFVGTAQIEEFAFGIFQDTSNFAVFQCRQANNTKEVKLLIRDAGSSVYGVSTSPTLAPQLFKVQYDFAKNEIKFFYDNAGSWTQLGTTQTFNLHDENPMSGVIGEVSSNTFFVDSSCIVDNFKLIKGELVNPP